MNYFTVRDYPTPKERMLYIFFHHQHFYKEGIHELLEKNVKTKKMNCKMRLQGQENGELQC